MENSLESTENRQRVGSFCVIFRETMTEEEKRKEGRENRDGLVCRGGGVFRDERGGSDRSTAGRTETVVI